jgi:DNA modification methylase
MEIVNVPVENLKEAEYNPRRLTDKQYADLTASMKEFGLVDPIIVNKHKDRHNVIVGGHMRYKIACSLGFKEIPVVYVDLDLENEKRLNIRLNRNTGEWDFSTMANNFDVEELIDLGFDKADLNFFETKEDDFNEEEELAKITEVKAKTGELYILGNHRILCGDSTKQDDWTKLMDGDKARLVFTDPPYSIDYKSRTGNSYSSGKFKGKKVFDDDKTEEEAFNFYNAILIHLYAFSTDDASIYWWYADKQEIANRMALIENGFSISQIILWVKTPMLKFGLDYLRTYEPCMFGWKKGNSHYKNTKYSNFQDMNSLDQTDWPQMIDLWYEKRDATRGYIHPTQKPVRLAERALKKNSQHGDIVVDAFGGSGSTLMACEQANRKARLMEMDPKYVHAILNRWAKYTGKDPVREDGVSWGEINK